MLVPVPKLPIADLLQSLDPRKVILLNKKREELKERLLARFTEEQLEELARELDSRNPEEIKIMLTFEDLVSYARKLGVPYADLLEEFEEFKRSLTD